MARTTCKADRSIAHLKGLDETSMTMFAGRLKASPKCRERRQLMREVRDWFRINVAAPVKADKGSRFSAQSN